MAGADEAETLEAAYLNLYNAASRIMDRPPYLQNAIVRVFAALCRQNGQNAIVCESGRHAYDADREHACPYCREEA